MVGEADLTNAAGVNPPQGKNAPPYCLNQNLTGAGLGGIPFILVGTQVVDSFIKDQFCVSIA